MCLKDTGGNKRVSQADRKGLKKHYEQFGKWKHGLQRHFLGREKNSKGG